MRFRRAEDVLVTSPAVVSEQWFAHHRCSINICSKGMPDTSCLLFSFLLHTSTAVCNIPSAYPKHSKAGPMFLGMCVCKGWYVYDHL